MLYAVGLFFIGVIVLVLLSLYGNGVFTSTVVPVVVPSSKLMVTDSKQEKEKTSDHDARQWLREFFDTTLPAWNVPADHLLIGSAHCTDYRFIEAQFESLKAFVKTPFTYFVINDVKRDERPDRYQAILEACTKHDIKHITFHPGLHTDRTILLPETQLPGDTNASARASDVVQFMLHIFRTHKGYTLMLDSDCVVVNPLVPAQILSSDFTYAGPPQTRWSEKRQKHLDYVWIVVILFDMANFPNPELMNLDCGWIDGVRMDTGGMWNTYIEKTNNIPRALKEDYTDPIMQEIKEKYPRVECFENQFLHFHNGSQWENITDEQHAELVKGWLETVQKIVQLRKV